MVTEAASAIFLVRSFFSFSLSQDGRREKGEWSKIFFVCVLLFLFFCQKKYI